MDEKKRYAENDKIWKINWQKWAFCKGYTEWSKIAFFLGLKLKVENITKNDSRTTLELFYRKKQIHKKPVIRKMTRF